MHVKAKPASAGAWSDFKKTGSGSGADVYANGDGRDASTVGVTSDTGFKSGADMSAQCTIFDPSDTDYKLTGADCASVAAAAICVKPVCPNGYEHFNQVL